MTRRKPYNPFDRWEVPLLRVAASAVILLLGVQMLLFFDGPRRHLSRVDRLEGVSVTWQTPLVAENPLVISEGSPVANRINFLRQGKTIVIRKVLPPSGHEIYLVANGTRLDDFHRGEARVTVYEGDYLEIDASRLIAPARFIISVPDGDLEYPLDGEVVEGQGGPLAIGKVKFKR